MSADERTQSRVLDTTVLVVTPENVAFDYRLAGPFTRAASFAIDFVLVLTVLLFCGMVLVFTGLAAVLGLLLFVGFVLWWGYGGLMEAFNNGQTWGKKALGIRVVSHTGLAINASQAILRNILSTADLFPPFFPGILSMAMTSRFQRLGDLAAGTIVILDGQRSKPRPPRLEEDTSSLDELIPVQFRPSTNLVEALAAYVGRRGELSAARRTELSRPLGTHFRRAWSLPKDVDTDLLLCAIYEKAVGGEKPRPKSKSRTSRDGIEKRPLRRVRR